MNALRECTLGNVAINLGRAATNFYYVAARVVAATANSMPNIQFNQDADGDYVIFGVKLPTWREWIVSSGLLFAVTLTALSFITGATLAGWSYLILTGLVLFGAYYLMKWSEIAPIAEQVQGLREDRVHLQGAVADLQDERERDRAERALERQHQQQLAQALVILLEAVGKRDAEMTQDWRRIAGNLDGNIGNLGRLVSELPNQLAATKKEIDEVMQLSARERAERLAEIEAANVRFGRLLGLIEAKATELERLNGAADRAEAHADDLGGIVTQLRAFHDAIARALPHVPPYTAAEAAAAAAAVRA